MQVKMQLFNH